MPDTAPVPPEADATLSKLRQLEEDIRLLKLAGDKENLLAEVAALESRLQGLKSQLVPAKRTITARTVITSFNEWFKSYWPLVSAIVGILVLLYAYFIYGVDPLSTYKETQQKLLAASITKRSAELHRELGDRLLERAEFKAAEDEFDIAQKIDPQDEKSIVALAVVRTLRSIEDAKEYAPETANARIQYFQGSVLGEELKLKETFPLLEGLSRLESDPRAKYLIPYMQGRKHLEEERFDRAESSFQQSIKQNQNFPAGYDRLGYTQLLAGRGIAAAMDNFRKAIQLSPEYAPALNNLGQCLVATKNFNLALEAINESYVTLPTAAAAINFGNAYLFKCDMQKEKDVRCQQFDERGKQIDEGLAYYEAALSMVDNQELAETDNYIKDVAVFNYMPAKEKPSETPTYEELLGPRCSDCVIAGSKKNYKTFLHYALSIKYALKGNLSEADKHFKSARQLDGNNYYNGYFSAQMQFILEYLAFPKDSKDKLKGWLTSRKAQLSESKK